MMAEFDTTHVERGAAERGSRFGIRGEREPGGGVHEPSDEPGAGGSIDVRMRSSHPLHGRLLPIPMTRGRGAGQ